MAVEKCSGGGGERGLEHQNISSSLAFSSTNSKLTYLNFHLLKFLKFTKAMSKTQNSKHLFCALEFVICCSLVNSLAPLLSAAPI